MVHVLRIASGALIVGLMTAVFTISFSAIVYTGELTAFLDRAVALGLLGAAVMTALGAFTFAYRGMVTHPQDITAILIAVAATNVAIAGAELGPDALFATVAVMIATMSFLAGVVAWLAGRFRLSYVARFMPYPVIGGFLAATGLMLVEGGIKIAISAPVTLSILHPETLSLWLPWGLGSVATLIAVRRAHSHGTLAMAAGVALGLFYLWLWISGTSLTEASQRGLLLGPFPEGGLLSSIDPAVLTQAEPRLILGQAPVILSVIAMTVLGGILNLQGISHIIGRDSQLDHDLKAIGITNIASSAVVGLMGFPAITNTTLARLAGLTGPVAGLGASAVLVMLLVMGTDLLSVLPRGLFTMLVGYLGLDMLTQWLWTERRRLPGRDFAVIVAILVVAATLGFIAALSVGILLAMIAFIVSYAGLDFIRSDTTLAIRRSMVERAEPDLQRLARLGKRVAIFELTGALFFGTAQRLRERLKHRSDAETLLIDFTRVKDIDASALSSLMKTVYDAQANGQTVVLSGLEQPLLDRMHRFAEGGAHPRPEHYAKFEDALQALEERLLDSTGHVGDIHRFRPSVYEELVRSFPGLELEEIFPALTLAAGEIFIHSGDESRDIFILVEGEAQATLGSDGKGPVVARFLPGALIGEMAYYQDAPRSATVTAMTPARVLRIDPEDLARREDLPPGLLAAIHRITAGVMARRLARVNRLLADSSL